MRKIQFINWFPEWKCIGVYKWGDRYCGLLDRSYLIGWFEIRIWNHDRPRDVIE